MLRNKGKPLATQVQSRADAMLRELEFLPAREANDLLILVKISGMTSDPGYVIDFSGIRAGVALENPVKQAECRLCTDGETVDLFATHLRDNLAHARTALAEANKPATTQTEPEHKPEDLAPKVQVEVRDRPAQVPDSQKAKGKIGTLGWVGIGVGGAGVLALGGGLGMMFAGSKHDGWLKPEKLNGHATNLGPSGIAVASVGLAALVTGVVLFVVDHKRVKKSRTR